MAKAYTDAELEIVGRVPNRRDPQGPGFPVYSFPEDSRQGMRDLYAGKGVWIPTNVETQNFCPQIIPDNIARGMVIEKNRIPVEQYGGPDMFGVRWTYVPAVEGSMEDPDQGHLFDDANDWEDVLVFPDVDSWDWAGSAEANKEWLDNGKDNRFWLLNGAGFERLISFMGFEDAAVALIDEDQTEALQALLDRLADLYCDIIDHVAGYYGDAVSSFHYHDDWGTQKDPFFSVDVASELFVAPAKKITDRMKYHGIIADLHSCGMVGPQIENIIAAGWQSWQPMAINNTQELYEKYGDKIILGVADDPLPKGATIEEQQAQAEAFIERFYSPEKPCTFSRYSVNNLTDAYREALYRASRMKAAVTA